MRFIILFLTLLLINPIQTTAAETFKLTAYCGCVKCCGKWSKYHKTASGTTPVAGRTIAVDKKIIPLGTVVEIDGKEYIAEDTGVKGKHIDIYFNDHQEALNFGVQHKEVIIKNTAPAAQEEEIEPPWIPVEKELPENYIDVLVSVEEPFPDGIDRYVSIGWTCIENGITDWYVDGRYLNANEANVVAWMPMPRPYENGENNE